jgi:PKD repeat protein
VATTTLTATRETIVTANAAGKTATVTVKINPRTGISIAGPTTPVSEFVPATFTVNVAGTASIRDVTVDFGDGDQRSLGAISASTTIQHTYEEAGSYAVRAIATEASGFTEQVTTALTVLPAQPPAVTILASNPRPTVNSIITLTATVSGNTSTIQQFQWDFGDGTTATVTSPSITKSYAAAGTQVIRVTVLQAVGPIGQGQTTVDVQAAGGGGGGQ